MAQGVTWADHKGHSYRSDILYDSMNISHATIYSIHGIYQGYYATNWHAWAFDIFFAACQLSRKVVVRTEFSASWTYSTQMLDPVRDRIGVRDIGYSRKSLCLYRHSVRWWTISHIHCSMMIYFDGHTIVLQIVNLAIQSPFSQFSAWEVVHALWPLGARCPGFLHYCASSLV